MTPKSANKVLHTPATISFVRSRMLYARPALNAKGRVRFGLRHIRRCHASSHTDSYSSYAKKKLDVFNRYPQSNNRNHTLHILKYIFPRQFGLHNVFTSRVNLKETTQPFKDYTLREEEISYFRNQRDTSRKDPEKSSELPGKIPKRLRGDLVVLIQNLQKRHQRCPYVELLRYYCPIEVQHQLLLRCQLMKMVGLSNFSFSRTPFLRLSAWWDHNLIVRPAKQDHPVNSK